MPELGLKSEGSNPLSFSKKLVNSSSGSKTPDSNLLFEERLRVNMKKIRKSKRRYNMNEGRKIIGFPGTTAKLIKWLKDNYFLDHENAPHYSLVHRKLMVPKWEKIYFKPKYDCDGNITNGCDSDFGAVLDYIITPFFKEKGLKYFFNLINNPKAAKRESDKINILIQIHNSYLNENV